LYIDNIKFVNFTFLSVTKSTQAYNDTYFQYGAVLGMAYPSSQWDPRFSDYMITKLVERGDIELYRFSIYMNSTYLRLILGGFEEDFIK